MNAGECMCQTTLAGIMARLAASTGQEVAWEHMLKSQKICSLGTSGGTHITRDSSGGTRPEKIE